MKSPNIFVSWNLEILHETKFSVPMGNDVILSLKLGKRRKFYFSRMNNNYFAQENQHTP
jgi:hypothetical protein